MQFLNLQGGVEITTIADIPSKGTGLGSSSTFTVGLLHVLNAFNGKYVSSEQLGRDSCHIEITLCGEPIGKQDQYAAAYGGLNLIEFKQDDSVVVSPIICQPSTVSALQAGTLVFYTGIVRSASTLLRQQNAELTSSSDKRRSMHRMVELAYVLREELHKDNVSAFGEILHENWVLKKTMTDGVSTPEIDEWYRLARLKGATGGKILGAGAGGFLMFYAPPERHEDIIAALAPMRRIPMSFEPLGSRIIFYH
jgi:D-glycero-alpha-D-manno-heptose-7-phosphate kinase